MEASETDWMHSRIVDIISVRDQLMDETREQKKKIDAEDGVIVFAEELAPAEMVQLSKYHIEGLVLHKAGLTSHSVILAQSLNIPCITGANWNRHEIRKNLPSILDGTNGSCIVNPSDFEIEQYHEKKGLFEKQKKELQYLNKQPNETACGMPYYLRANVEFLVELNHLKNCSADGIGLLRTETILLETDGFDKEKQMNFYEAVAESADGSPVIVRLLDVGGDKLLDESPEELNPFLGWRGTRMLLDEKDLLNNQLEAILESSGKFPGQLQILAPMITNLNEIRELRVKVKECMTNLNNQKINYDKNIPVGIMVEIPSIALLADEAGKLADFFSIGTNDLTQYTLAVDRGNDKISKLYQSIHPAVWKLIKNTVDGAKNNQIPISVCGELAARPVAAATLIGMGIDDLSMNAGSILNVKSLLNSRSHADMKSLATSVLSAKSTEDIEEIYEKWLEK